MIKKITYSVIGVFVFLVTLGFLLPKEKVVDTPVVKTNPVATIANQTPVVLDNKKVEEILTTSVNYYQNLLSTGKTTLGNTQYKGANGLKSFDDPNSSAVKFGSFRTNTCIKNDPSVNAISAYKEVSDMYVSTDTPTTLDDWNYDTNTIASDICIWAGDAVSWQIGEVPITKLKTDELKITNDITKAREDIKQISK